MSTDIYHAGVSINPRGDPQNKIHIRFGYNISTTGDWTPTTYPFPTYQDRSDYEVSVLHKLTALRGPGATWINSEDAFCVAAWLAIKQWGIEYDSYGAANCLEQELQEYFKGTDIVAIVEALDTLAMDTEALIYD